ncbi:MAG TPA: hypothetical protein VIN71_08075 [Pseudomonadales bacterium]
MTDAVVNVVCLKWGSKYPAEYVNRLYRMVQRHLSRPHRFVCLTDDGSGIVDGVEIRALAIDPELRGWWYKLQLFQPQLADLAGTTLFVDLDVVIVGNMDVLFDYQPGRFCIIRDLQAGKVYNSSVFRLEIGAFAEVWQRFQADKRAIVQRLHGDQDWISECMSDVCLWPEQWVVSYKKQCQARARFSFGVLGYWLRRLGLLKTRGEAVLPADARIVYFHGKPDPDDVADGSYGLWKKAPWIRSAWEER